MKIICSICGKEAADHCRYSLCSHVLCVDCDLMHDQVRCDRPSYARKEFEAEAKRREMKS